MTPMGKDKAYHIMWAISECKSRDYTIEIEFREEYAIITMERKGICKVEIFVFDTGTSPRKDYKLSIQTPSVNLDESTNNINDVIADINRYAKGWRK